MVSKIDEASPKEFQNLKKWIAKYYGKEVLDGKEYLAFEKYMPNSLKGSQIVLIQVYPPEKANSLSPSSGFRIYIFAFEKFIRSII